MLNFLSVSHFLKPVPDEPPAEKPRTKPPAEYDR